MMSMCFSIRTAGALAAMATVCFSTADGLAQRPAQPAVGQPQAQQKPLQWQSPKLAQSPTAQSKTAQSKTAQSKTAQSPTAQSQTAPPSESSKPSLTAPDRKIREAFLKTESAASPEDFTAIINACQEGIDEGATPQGAAYARKLKAWSHNKRGEKLADTGAEAEALKDFEIAVALDPLLWRYVQNRGVSRGATGDQKGAMADFDRVVELNPDYANAWFNRGQLKFEAGDFAGALQDYTRAIRIQPGDAVIYINRGHANSRLGRTNESLADYTRAVQLKPDDAVAHVERADFCALISRYEQAANDYRDAIRLDPQMARAYQGAAWQMATCPNARFRNAQMAVEATKKAIELNGDKDYRYLETLAAAHASAGDFAEARDAAMRALSITPEKKRSRIEQQLKLYEKNQAYRDGGPAETVRSATRTP